MGGFNTQQFNPDATAQGTGSATLNSDLLYAALRKAGVQIAPGRGPSSLQISDAIGEENRMIGGWNLTPLMILGERLDIWNAVARQQSYTIGQDPRGTLTPDWPGERPQKILAANLLLPTATGTIEPVRRKIDIWDAKQWAAITFQAVYTYPEGLYHQFNDPQRTPFSRIYFKPIPDAAYQIELLTWQKIPKFASKDDAVLLPDGYEDAIVNNLAVRLSSYPWIFQRPLDPQVRIDAQISLDLIRQSNACGPRIETEPEFLGGYGYYNYKSGLVE